MSGDLCSVCKTRFFRDGVPYSEQEKARAQARRYRRLAERLLQTLLAAGGIAVLARMAVVSGLLPGPVHWLAVVCAGAALLAGLGAALLAVMGLRQSRSGQPGPAVSGVFPASYAAVIVAVGLVPTLLALVALRTMLSD